VTASAIEAESQLMHNPLAGDEFGTFCHWCRYVSAGPPPNLSANL